GIEWPTDTPQLSARDAVAPSLSEALATGLLLIGSLTADDRLPTGFRSARYRLACRSPADPQPIGKPILTCENRSSRSDPPTPPQPRNGTRSAGPGGQDAARIHGPPGRPGPAPHHRTGRSGRRGRRGRLNSMVILR
ncbi:hypothetical protein ABZW03_18785, partial [Kitasatospora sp. NPDC004799]